MSLNKWSARYSLIIIQTIKILSRSFSIFDEIEEKSPFTSIYLLELTSETFRPSICSSVRKKIRPDCWKRIVSFVDFWKSSTNSLFHLV